MNNKFFSFIKTNADILIVLAAGIFLRLRIIVQNEFWFDEAYTGILLRKPLPDFILHLQNDTNPPLYYISARMWTAFFGTGEVAIRSLSLVFGVLTIYFVYLLLKETLHKEAGVLGALFVAVSPFFVEYSVEARTYSLYGFLAVLGVYFLVKKSYVPFLISLVLLSLSHYVAVFYSLLLFAFFVYQKFSSDKSLKNIKPVEAILSLGFIGVLGGIYLHVQKVEQNVNDGWIETPSLLSIQKNIAAFMYGIKTKLPGAAQLNDFNPAFVKVSYFGWLFLALFVVLLGLYIYKNKEALKTSAEFKNFLVFFFMFLAIPLVLILLGNFSKYNVYVERYMFPSALFFVVSLAFLLKKVFSFEILLLLAFFYVLSVTRIVPHSYYFGMKELAQRYETGEQSVTFTSPMDYVVGRYYFGENAIHIQIKDPQNPNDTYEWWPMVRPNAFTPTFDNAVIVNPDPGRFNNFPGEFLKIGDFGSYGTYIYKN